MTDIRQSTNPPAWGFIAGLGEKGKKQFEAAVEMQKVVLDTIEDLNRIWLARAQSEAKLATELVGKLATARSIPDVAAVYQDGLSRQLEMATDDGRRVFADGEKLLKASVRALYNGPGAGLSS